MLSYKFIKLIDYIGQSWAYKKIINLSKTLQYVVQLSLDKSVWSTHIKKTH